MLYIPKTQEETSFVLVDKRGFFRGAGDQSRSTFQVQIHPPLTFSAYFAQCICPKRCAGFLVWKYKKPAPEQSQWPFRSRFSLILQYFGLFLPWKQENCLIYLVDKSGNLFCSGRRIRTLSARGGDECYVRAQISDSRQIKVNSPPQKQNWSPGLQFWEEEQRNERPPIFLPKA